MNLVYMNGDLLSVKSGLIVHGCNAMGVMGSGVAVAIKKAYSENFSQYAEAIRVTPVNDRLGMVVYHRVSPQLSIANAVTQRSFGREPNTRYISYDALVIAFENIARTEFTNIHVPKIGAGLGGGEWRIIERIIETSLNYRQNVTVWEL